MREFIKDGGGRVCKAIVINLIPRKGEETDRTVMAAVEGSEHEIPTDLVPVAADFTRTQAYVADAFGIELDARTDVVTERGAYRTDADQIFVIGDIHRGQPLVVWAIQEGREAAKTVDRGMMGYTSLV